MVQSPYEPEVYQRARPDYPWELFQPMLVFLSAQVCSARSEGRDLEFLDLGCGTGSVYRSLEPALSSWRAHWTLMDPNPKMLERFAPSEDSKVSIQVGAAKSLGDSSKFFDAIWVGSAWHWLELAEIQEVFGRLRPGGTLWVGEYQLPKLMPTHHPLNEWVRRSFNEIWKFEDQIPRGSLEQMTEVVRKHPEMSEVSRTRLKEKKRLNLEAFVEFVFSQARFLDFENRTKNLDERNRVFEALAGLWERPGELDFYLDFDSKVFKKRLI